MQNTQKKTAASLRFFPLEALCGMGEASQVEEEEETELEVLMGSWRCVEARPKKVAERRGKTAKCFFFFFFGGGGRSKS